MGDFKIFTVLFDYPDDTSPMFYLNLTEDFINRTVTCLRFDSRQDGYRKFLKESYGGESLYSKFWHFKLYELSEELKKETCEIVLFLDALDTNIIAPVDEIITKFKNTGKKVILGAENDIWPETEYTHLYELQGNKNSENMTKYVNSGTYIGYRDYIIECLDRILEHGIDRLKDDQGAWSWIYLIDKEVDLDLEMEIFFSTHKNKESISNKVVVGDPCVIHDNGPYGEQTVKLNTTYMNTTPMPPLSRGCLIPLDSSQHRQRPEDWLNGTTGLFKLITMVNEHFDGKAYNIIETGSYYGESSFMFLKHGNVKSLYCVDPYIDHYDLGDSSAFRQSMGEVKNTFQKNILDRYPSVTHLEKSSLDVVPEDVSCDIDLIYLDGDHRIDYVKKEIDMMCSMFSPSIISGHDYNMVGSAVEQALGKPDAVFEDYSWIKVIR